MPIVTPTPANPPGKCPCMLTMSQTNSTSTGSLRLEVALKESAPFIQKYRLVPQTPQEYLDMLSGKFAVGKTIVNAPVKPHTLPMQNVPFYFTKADRTSVRVFPSLWQGLRVAEIFMPGAETPTCDGMHFPSVLNINTLHALKAAGVDVVIITVPDSSDAAGAWARKQLHKVDLEFLLANLPGDDVDARITPHATLPLIVMRADPGREWINAHGLGLVIPRLGMASQRAFTLRDTDGELLHITVAENPTKEKCTPVLGPAIVDAARIAFATPKQTPSLSKL